MVDEARFVAAHHAIDAPTVIKFNQTGKADRLIKRLTKPHFASAELLALKFDKTPPPFDVFRGKQPQAMYFGRRNEKSRSILIRRWLAASRASFHRAVCSFMFTICRCVESGT